MDCGTLREILRYDERTGKLYWKYRPDARSQFNGRYAGKEAFTNEMTNGYKQGEISNKAYLAHRVIWCMVYGSWPKGEIDHINGNRSDNRIDNLRDTTRVDNGRNIRLKKNNTSGYCGVSYHKQSGKWRARVKYNYNEIHVGMLDTKEEAHIAITKKREELNFYELHGNDKDAPVYRR